MSAYRTKRVIPNSLNTPTSVRIENIANIDEAEAEKILSEFIQASESNVSGRSDQVQSQGLSTSNTDSSAILSQLKRIQRSLRGLPPLIAEQQAQPPISRTNTDTKPINKKIKFDDSEAEDKEDTIEEDKEDDKEVEKENEEVEEEMEDEETDGTKDEKNSKKKEKKEKKEKKSKKRKLEE